MNSVLAYKQFCLGEGLADLFAYEIKNFEAFKASLSSKVKMLRDSLGYENCSGSWEKEPSWEKTWNKCE